MTDLLSFEIADGIATITLDRPDDGNALNMALTRQLLQLAIRVDEDSEVKAVILTGNGRLFCAGGDVRAFAQAGDALPALLKEITVYLHGAVARLARMQKPLITAINGAAAGAGMSLALLGDVVLMAENAIMTTAYSAIGLSPDGGISWLLPRLAGLKTAQELILSSRKVPAREALALGLVSRVLPGEMLLQDAQAVARALASQNVEAIGEVRTLLLGSLGTSLETQLELEARAIARMAGTNFARSKAAEFAAR